MINNCERYGACHSGSRLMRNFNKIGSPVNIPAIA